MVGWPRDAAGLVEVQRALGRAAAPRWQRPAGPLRVGACFVCFDRHPAGRVQGAGPELGWAAAAVASRTTPEDAVTIVLAAIRRARTPFPLRRARQAARTARSAGRHRPIGTIGLDAASASPWAGTSKVVLPGDLPIIRRSVVRLVV